MDRRPPAVAVVVAGFAVMWACAVAPAWSAGPAGSWGRAIEVPGLAALNTGPLDQGGHAEVVAVSCASAGNCTAGGYHTGHHGQQGFVADERNGVWGQATEVPGLAALNTGGYGGVNSLSCASAGNCAAGGFYSNPGQQAFVVDERNGVWGLAIKPPGLAALDTGRYSEVSSVSCGAPGNCAAGGQYSWNRGFVAAERNGHWGKAIEVPGPRAKTRSGITSVSCATPGTCAVGGTYVDRSQHTQGFVARLSNGVWDRAIEVPGLGALNKGGFAVVNWVSCAPSGPCVAGGFYASASGRKQGFVVGQTG
jgi:hypothetical protein